MGGYHVINNDREIQKEPVYAGFWLRVHASLIDWFLVAVITFIVAWVFNQNNLIQSRKRGSA